MKKIILASISVLIFCFSSFAQKEDSSPCPSLELFGPSGLIQAGDTMIYTASLSIEPENSRLRYEWTVEHGEIVAGQGTNSITIEPQSDNVYVTVEVYGLPENCGTLTATETSPCMLTAPEPEKVNEFVYSDSDIDKSVLDEFAQKLKDDPNNSAYILIGYETDSDKNDFDKRTKEIRQYLTKNKNIEADRFIYVNAGKIKNLIQLWIVPPGATPPTPDFENLKKEQNSNDFKEEQIKPTQSNVGDVAPCPTLSVTGPSEPFIPNISQTQTFSAIVDYAENYKIEYKWLVSGGEIVKGQGTQVITVFQPTELAGGNVTATVEISGNFPSYCGSRSASETAVVFDLIGTKSIQTDEFAGSLSEIKNNNLDNFAKLLQEDPTVRGHLIWYSRKNLSKNAVEQTIRKVTEYLIKEHNIDKAKITIQTSLFDKDLVTFWIVPAGAFPPEP